MRHKFLSSIIVLSICLVGSACAIDGTKDFQKEAFSPPPSPAPYVPEAPEAQTRKLVILHTNDEHSHLFGYGSYADYPFLPDAAGHMTAAAVGAAVAKATDGSPVQDLQTVGGIVRRQYLVNKIRAESTDPVLLLSAGDSTMGTIFHPATPVAAPDFMAMTFLGYDFVTLGNHEFDFGPDSLSAAINALGNNSFGGGLPFIATNIHFEDVVAGHGGDGLKQLYGEGNSDAPIVPWATRTLANGLKVGFVGYMGYAAALVAPAASPISFSLPMDGAACSSTVACDPGLRCYRSHCVDVLGDPQDFIAALVADVQPVVTELKTTEKCDLVVALSHAGKLEDMAIAMYSSGIDVVIGGHSHDEIPPTVISSLVGSGKSIIVQAGSNGLQLGQLTITVDPDGVVDFVADESLLHPIDYMLDVDILDGSDFTVSPPVVSPAFERALTLTGGILGPVMAGMNAALGPALGVPGFNVVAPLVTSDHDIEGGSNSEDSALAHLVTDAELLSLGQAACLPQYAAAGAGYTYVVAVQANGVLRESLLFSKGASEATTFADIFSVVPLGASPFAPTIPGYPLVMFQLDAPSLLAGLDVGVTKGIDDNGDFFLTYAGMRVTYDKTFAPLNPADLTKDLGTGGVTTPTGRVMTIDMDATPGAAPTWVNIYTYVPGVPFYGRWHNIDIAGGKKILVITNMYLAGFLEAFGITPYHPYTGAAITPNPAFGALSKLAFTFLCQDMTLSAPDCGNAGGPVPMVRPCLLGAGDMTAGGTWKATLMEVKEWAVLAKFLLSPPLAGHIPTLAYTSPLADAVVRVKDVTP